jgi:hypothetical protein
MNSMSLAAVPNPGYLVVATNDPTPHWSGGKPEARAVSPNTGKALLSLLSLDLSAPELATLKLSLAPPRLPLLYSWQCGMHYGRLSYRVHPAGVDLVEFNKGLEDANFPYSGYPTEYEKQAVALVPQSDDDVGIVRRLNQDKDGRYELYETHSHINVPRTQVGGEIRLMQWPIPDEQCPLCRQPMPLLASVGDLLPGGQRQTGNDFVQTVYWLCANCSVVSATNMSD